jgi:hypothetical protein
VKVAGIKGSSVIYNITAIMRRSKMALEMVAPSTLVPISKETDTSFNGNNTIAFGIKCYEAGMVQVLRGIAEDNIYRLQVCNSDVTRERYKNCNVKEKEIETAFNSSDLTLIKEYVEAISEANACEAEDHYIQGFLDGYRYLANRMAYKSEGFDKSRYTKKENEENE